MIRIWRLGFAIISALVVIVSAGCKDGAKPTSQKSSSASVHVGKTESRNNISSSTITSSSDHAGFNSGHLVFVNESGHPLINEVLPLLTKSLQALPQVQRMQVVSPRQAADSASKNVLPELRAPDLFARLDLRSIEEEGILSKKLKATVICTLGSEPWQSAHHVSDHTTPPVVSFTWAATLDHQSTFTGIHSDRYGTVAAAVAAEFNKGLTNLIGDMSRKYPALPPLPDYLYGPYIPVPDFGFLRSVNARRVASHYGLFTHNRTYWKFQTSSNAVPQLKGIMDAMQAEGWKVENSSLTNTVDYYISARSEGATVEIFRPRESRFEPEEEDKQVTTEFVVHYRKPFTQAEIEGAMEKLLSEGTPIETLLRFEHSFSGSQRKRFYSLLEKGEGATTPQVYLTLANHYLGCKETNTAITMLTRAKAMSALVSDAGDWESKIDSAVKKISPKSSLKLEPTVSTYRDMGFVELTNSFAPATFQKAFGSPILLFHEGTGGPHVLAVWVEPLHGGESRWTVVQLWPGMRSKLANSSGADGTIQQTFSMGDFKMKLTAKPDKSKKIVEYEIEPVR